jgi:hypothetical protein
MSGGTATPGAPTPPSRLRGLIERSTSAPQAADERCDLCSEPVPPEHRHLLDVERRRLMCACRACSLLFDHRGAGGRRYRLVPDRCLEIVDLDLDDAGWLGLQIPVGMAFFFRSSAVGRVVAFYPGPMGATESLLDLAAWEGLAERNPVLSEMEDDVEALLVNRARAARQHWIVPVERCYRLVGLIRMRWKGFGGGQEVWEEIERFFQEIRAAAKPVTRDGMEATWEGSGSAGRT